MIVHENLIEKRVWTEFDLQQIKRIICCTSNLFSRIAEMMAVIMTEAYSHGDSHIEGVKMGDHVVLLWTQGDLTYTADDMVGIIGND